MRSLNACLTGKNKKVAQWVKCLNKLISNDVYIVLNCKISLKTNT